MPEITRKRLKRLEALEDCWRRYFGAKKEEDEWLHMREHMESARASRKASDAMNDARALIEASKKVEKKSK